jgi:hypothetical protein
MQVSGTARPAGCCPFGLCGSLAGSASLGSLGRAMGCCQAPIAAQHTRPLACRHPAPCFSPPLRLHPTHAKSMAFAILGAGRRMGPPRKQPWASKSAACRRVTFHSLPLAVFPLLGTPWPLARVAPAPAWQTDSGTRRWPLRRSPSVTAAASPPPPSSSHHHHHADTHTHTCAHSPTHPSPPPRRCTGTVLAATGAPPSAGARRCLWAWQTRRCCPLPTMVSGLGAGWVGRSFVWQRRRPKRGGRTRVLCGGK